MKKKGRPLMDISRISHKEFGDLIKDRDVGTVSRFLVNNRISREDLNEALLAARPGG